LLVGIGKNKVWCINSSVCIRILCFLFPSTALKFLAVTYSYVEVSNHSNFALQKKTIFQKILKETQNSMH
jgi:hypothetical protein